MSWQPIETAPKDGTRILAVCRHMKVETVIIVSWTGDEHEGDEEEGGWTDDDFRAEHPTHWQPLPAPPRTLESDLANNPG